MEQQQKQKPIKTIEDFLDTVKGGYKELERVTGATFWSIAQWKRKGIPSDYWKALAKEYPITISELFYISERAKDSFKSSQKS